MLEASVSYSRRPGCTPRGCGHGLLSLLLLLVFLIADALVAHLEVVDLGYCQGQAEAWITALDGAKSVDFFFLRLSFSFMFTSNWRSGRR